MLPRALLILLLMTATPWAQTPLPVGPPEAAFQGGPIHLSKNAITMLRSHFQGDFVPQIPQPFRGKLDIALVSRDWARIEVLKKELTAVNGPATVLVWEQTRFLATGGAGIAELHARDLAATGSSGVSETAAMLWLYAAALTFTDGHKCGGEGAAEAHLDRLRGPDFAAVTRIIATLADDRLTAMRDLALRLEQSLSPGRDDDGVCRAGGVAPDIKPDAIWRPEAAEARAMLPKHLLALCVVMRPRPATKP